MSERRSKGGLFKLSMYSWVFIAIGGIGIFIGVIIGDGFFVLAGLFATISGFYLFNLRGMGMVT
ncbi:MAG: hypothetical protein ACFFD4_40375, partial [Candidatus Odinarchaeota archaeon]